MDVQAYLSKFDALKVSYATLMPCTKDATVHAEQQSKYFMVMALKGLPSELESVRNQILSGTTIPNYDTVSEQLLRLATPHAFGPVFPPSIVASTPSDTAALVSLDNNQNRLRGGTFNSKPRLKCDHSVRTVFCSRLYRYAHFSAAACTVPAAVSAAFCTISAAVTIFSGLISSSNPVFFGILYIKIWLLLLHDQ
ncbi:unnamed protein product [Vicia faba]|uniref:Uncharacterized protein n=1 Tax=Vicia faba TaxID=3906 RepID=A0AAV0Z684_VICFA|nr:unnamed protein product [Vicia faba]